MKIIWCMFLGIWSVADISPKNQNEKEKKKKKIKRTLGDIIILQLCTKNHDHMLYCSWDMVRDRCNCYFSYWAIFCPFAPLIAQKMKASKKWKKHLEISSFCTCVTKIMIRWCMVSEIWCARDRWTDGRTDGKSDIEVGVPRKKETPTQVFSCGYHKMFKNSFFIKHLQWLLRLKNF